VRARVANWKHYLVLGIFNSALLVGFDHAAARPAAAPAKR
jgi:hypothetical protein